ncbi:Myb-like DNA-binding domain containing protein [Histomonas meleagridis]|uniref:Myb-like DNA-binding domain containing protein n=1 Tax=Histomonas meleagridis TaxID=135588 RepID=UPI0035597AAB|nr:Myb-like DNA-binding domain containing protein [Histomonas meleagridis]KAH0796840.1 Myb-like DNA-binding domain containing protein [Histomonas meleagridis]
MSTTPKKNHRNQFTPTEDVLLKLIISQIGTSNWQAVAQRIGNRTARQCRDRWNHYLSPYTNLSEWTPEEDAILLENYKLLGPKWGKIASFFPGRTDVSTRNRCCKLLRKQNAMANNVNPPYQFENEVSSKPKVVLPGISSLPFQDFMFPQPLFVC